MKGDTYNKILYPILIPVASKKSSTAQVHHDAATANRTSVLVSNKFSLVNYLRILGIAAKPPV